MERLQKVMAHAGVASRRKAEEMILTGQVSVNGQVVKELGVKVSDSDEISVNGKLLSKEKLVYFVLNKPKGCITATFDDRGRSVVTDFLIDVEQRVYPVGRLDYNTTGVLILTNDGSLVNKLLRPEVRLEKEYQARVEGKISESMIKTMEQGLDIGDHYTMPARVVANQYNPKKNQSIVSIVITEGKYHQVKRMFETVGSKVMSLKRTRFGCLDVKNMKLGSYRVLSSKEISDLLALTKKRK